MVTAVPDLLDCGFSRVVLGRVYLPWFLAKGTGAENNPQLRKIFTQRQFREEFLMLV